MFNDKNLDQLRKMAEESSKKLNIELRILEETFADTLRNVKDEDKPKIEKIQSMSQKAISYAKNGDIKKAQEIINDFKKNEVI